MCMLYGWCVGEIKRKRKGESKIATEEKSETKQNISEEGGPSEMKAKEEVIPPFNYPGYRFGGPPMSFPKCDSAALYDKITRIKEEVKRITNVTNGLYEKGHYGNAIRELMELTLFWTMNDCFSKMRADSYLRKQYEATQTLLIGIWVKWMDTRDPKLNFSKLSQFLSRISRSQSHLKVSSPNYMNERKRGYQVASQLALNTFEDLKEILETGEGTINESASTSRWRINKLYDQKKMKEAFNLSKYAKLNNWTIRILISMGEVEKSAHIALESSLSIKDSEEFADAFFKKKCLWGSHLLLEKQYYTLIDKHKSQKSPDTENCLTMALKLINKTLLNIVSIDRSSETYDRKVRNSWRETVPSLVLLSIGTLAREMKSEERSLKEEVAMIVPKDVLPFYLIELIVEALLQFPFHNFSYNDKNEGAFVGLLNIMKQDPDFDVFRLKLSTNAMSKFNFKDVYHYSPSPLCSISNIKENLVPICVGKNRELLWNLLDTVIKTCRLNFNSNIDLLKYFVAKDDLRAIFCFLGLICSSINGGGADNFFYYKDIVTTSITSFYERSNLFDMQNPEDASIVRAFTKFSEPFSKIIKDESTLFPLARMAEAYTDKMQAFKWGFVCLQKPVTQTQESVLAYLIELICSSDFSHTSLPYLDEEILEEFQVRAKRTMIMTYLSLKKATYTSKAINTFIKCGDISNALNLANKFMDIPDLKQEGSNLSANLLELVEILRGHSSLYINEEEFVEKIFKMSQHDSTCLFEGAKKLLEMGDTTRSLQWAKKAIDAPGKQDRDAISKMFCSIAQETGQPDAAVNFALNGFRAQPNLMSFQRVRETSDDWYLHREVMIQFLKSSPELYEAKMEIFLSENLINEITSTMNNLTPSKKSEILANCLDLVMKGRIQMSSFRKINKVIVDTLFTGHNMLDGGHWFHMYSRSPYSHNYSQQKSLMELFKKIVEVDSLWAVEMVRQAIDNLVKVLTSSQSDYSRFCDLMKSTKALFYNAGVQSEWPGYFDSITYVPEIRRKGKLVVMLSAIK
eukprot:TRINITY_DN3339_c0_g1_i5.p1 TRINITY_DN3339_c0_g1~~TRINITY_DN3339_c0_g1_i5.p1  ORF type:complete len:1027 (+),score=196.80 TRINITY_DN3339_c0_g1_i5:37-3117(+)